MRLFLWPFFALTLGLAVTLANLSPTVSASASNLQKKQAGNRPQDLQSIMHSLYHQIATLNPLNSQAKVSSKPGSQGQLKTALKQMSDNIESLPQKMENQPGYRLIARLFKDHIYETQKVLSGGEIEKAQQMVQATTSLCILCHTQMPQGGERHLNWKKDLLAGPQKNAYHYAEFLYATHRYKTANKIYNILLADYPNSVLQPKDLMKVLLRKLTYFARVQRDPEAAINELKKLAKQPKWPVNLRQDINQWIEAFEKWKNQDAKDPLNTLDRVLAASAAHIQRIKNQRHLSGTHPEIVPTLRLSGLLFQYLLKDTSDRQTAKILYYLGQLEERLSEDFFLSLSRSYFRQCADQFAKFPEGKLCRAALARRGKAS